MVRLADRVEFTSGSTREVRSDGSFTWQRRAKSDVTVEVYFTDGQIESNTVAIAGSGSTRTVVDEGFTWTRIANRKVNVYFQTVLESGEKVRSTRITIAGPAR